MEQGAAWWWRAVVVWRGVVGGEVKEGPFV